MNPVEQCKAEVRAYLAASGMSWTGLGKAALGDPRFVHQLLKHDREPRFRTIERLRGWLKANPPEQARKGGEAA